MGHISSINMLLLIQTLQALSVLNLWLSHIINRDRAVANEHGSHSCRAFDTNKQKEPTETSKSLDEQYQSLNKLLAGVSKRRDGTSAQLSAWKDDLGEMIEKMKVSSTQNTDTQLKLYKQKAILNEVRSDIDWL